MKLLKNETKVAGEHGPSAGADARTETEIAAIAAAARWGKSPSATHKGNFKDDFGIDVDCYVLDDPQKTAVVSQRGMAVAIGLSERGNAFLRFAGSKSVSPYLGAQVRDKIQNPLVFQWGSAGARLQPPSTINGYDVTVLADICKAILDADSDKKLSPNQAHLAKQARVILSASAKAGLQGLVYALAGYDATRQEVIQAFKMFVREEAREYEKEFPDQLYEELVQALRATQADPQQAVEVQAPDGRPGVQPARQEQRQGFAS